MNRPFLALIVLFSCGIAAGGVVNNNLPAVITVLCVAAAGIIIFRKKMTSVLLITAAAGFVVVSLSILLINSASVDEYLLDMKSFTVRVCGMPERSGGRTYFDGSITGIKTGSRDIKETKSRAPKVRVTVEEKANLKIDHGDILEIEAGLKKPQKAAYKGGFDYSLYLKRNGILYTAYASDFKVIKIGSKTNIIGKISYSAREKLLALIYTHVPAPQAGILEGVMLGSRKSIPANVYDDFKKTGTAHILAVSGMNAGLITVFVFVFLKLLRVKKEISAFIAMFCIWCFALITGGEASIVRAAIMASFILFGYVIQRDGDALNSLCAAGFFILLFDSQSLFEAGFQLSFLAAFGIIYLNEKVSGYFSFLPKWVSETLSATVTAQIFVLPVMINTFNQLSIISVFANLIIVPLSGFATILGFAMWLFGSIAPVLAAPFGAAQWLIIEVMTKSSAVMGQLPLASVSLKSLPAAAVILYYIYFLALPHADVELNYKNLKFKHSLIIIVILVYTVSAFPKKGFAASYIPAQGINSVFYRLEDGSCMLVLACDEGKVSQGLKNTVLSYLRSNGINKIDYAVFYDMKEQANIRAITENFSVGMLYADEGTLHMPDSALEIGAGSHNFYAGKNLVGINPEGVTITGNEEHRFVKVLTPIAAKSKGGVIYMCYPDKGSLSKVSKENKCLYNGSNVSVFGRKPDLPGGYDVGEKGAFEIK
ncbi:MAG: ComEC family competence protein [Candidatus Goldbacteria bacterium]|nr:ComEC family competence protein [Candidatus Goldiibacteriota bacterium]